MGIFPVRTRLNQKTTASNCGFFLTKAKPVLFLCLRSLPLNQVVDEEKELAAAVGLSNGHLPDMRDNDRERLERYNPHTVFDSMMYTPVIPKQTNLFEQAKQNCLADYVSKVEENLSEFNNDQINRLLEILNQEKANRLKSDIDF